MITLIELSFAYILGQTFEVTWMSIIILKTEVSVFRTAENHSEKQ